MVKGVEISIVSGDYIKDIDKYTIRLNDTLKLSAGNYIKFPMYAKNPNIWFNVLDNSGVVKIEDNKLISLKEGSTSIGVMKNQRLLKRAEIRVVDPKVNSVELNLSDELKFVGDTSSIKSVVNMSYSKFKDIFTPEYKSSDEDVLKVDGENVEAVGVGKAKIIVTCGGEESYQEFEITSMVSSIDINSVITIEKGEKLNLNPKIITKPKGQKHPSILYNFASYKIPSERCISITSSGRIEGIKEGSEQIEVSCGNKKKTVTINVEKQIISNKEISDLKATSSVEDNNLVVNLSWSSIANVSEYEIYLRDNLEEDSSFKKFDTVSVDSNSSTVKHSVRLEIENTDKYDFDLYVVGKSNKTYTKKSNIVNISKNDEPDVDITKLRIENLALSSDEEKVYVTWNKLNVKSCSYSIYVKDKSAGEKGFTLYNNRVYSNSYSFARSSEVLNIEVYVVGISNGNKSIASDIVKLVE
jgi:hypothetical protein